METNNTLFHCKFYVTRLGVDYQCVHDFSSTIETYLEKSSGQILSIGSGQEDFIHFRGLPPGAVSFAILDDALILHTSEPVQLLIDEKKIQTTAGQRLNFPFTEEGMQLFGFSWKITLGSHHIIFKVATEEEHLSPQVVSFLEGRHGKMQKIQEGRSSLLFRTEEGKVLKVLRPSFVKSTGVVQRFITAARKFQKLPGHLFLKTYEIVYQQQHGLCYIVMEFFAGETLQNYLARKGILPLAEAESIVFHLAQNLAILQKYGYCFRNLTPENILIGADGQIRLTGFFLLKAQDVQLTLDGAQMVIPKYSAPEQAQNPSAVNIMADIFSLGAIFYHLLAGEPPFQFSTPKQYAEYLNSGKELTAEEIARQLADIPAPTGELIASLLFFDRNKRPDPQTLLDKLSQHNPRLVLDVYFVQTMDRLGREHTEQENKDELADFSPTIVALLNKLENEKIPDGDSGTYCLEIVSGPPEVKRQAYHFTGERTIVVGRSGDFRIEGDLRISHKHAQIVIRKDRCCLTDMGSANGTYLGGEKLGTESREIALGTEFKVGHTVLRYRRASTAILDKPECDISAEDIGQLAELRIITLNEDVPSSLAEAGKHLRSVYEDMDKRITSPMSAVTLETPRAKFDAIPGRFGTGHKQIRRQLCIGAAILVVLAISLLVLLVKLTPGKKNLAKPSPDVLRATSPTVVSQPKPEKVTIRSEPLASATLEQEMKAQQMVRWEQHWIGQATYDELAQKYEMGSQRTPVAFTATVSELAYDVQKHAIYAHGQLSPAVLGHTMKLRLQANFVNAFGDALYAGKEFDIDQEQRWQVAWDLPEALPPGIYYLCLSLRTEMQNNFTRDFLRLTSSQTWRFALAGGTKAAIIQHYQEHSKTIQMILKDSNELYKRLQMVTGKKVQSGQEWAQFTKKWQDALRRLENKLASRHTQRKESPLLARVDSKLAFVLPFLQTVFQATDKAMHSPKTPGNILELFTAQSQWEVLYDEICILLTQETKRIEESVKEKN